MQPLLEPRAFVAAPIIIVGIKVVRIFSAPLSTQFFIRPPRTGSVAYFFSVSHR